MEQFGGRVKIVEPGALATDFAGRSFDFNNDDSLIEYQDTVAKLFAVMPAMTAVHPITALQIEYSLWSRDMEAEVLPTIREFGIGLVAYAPLSRGFLSGEFKRPKDLKDSRINMPRYQGENFYKNLELVEKIKTLASEKGCTASQLAIAWVLAQGEDIITIPGTKHINKLEENIASENIQLTIEDLKSIEAIMPAGIVAGTRYPEIFLASLKR